MQNLYSASITLYHDIKIDLFTPSMFRFRHSTLPGEKFPAIYDIPFAVGKVEPWPPVAYTHWEDEFCDYLETDMLRIRVSKQAKQWTAWSKDGATRLYPSEKPRYGLFTNGYTVFDSAAVLGEANDNSRYAHWFYNPATGLYDIYLADDALMDQYFIYGPEYEKLFAQLNELVGPEPLLPKKGYGFFQTQHLECAGSQARLLALADTLRERNIPCDNLIVDFEWGDGCDGETGVEWGSQIDWSSNYTTPLSPAQMFAALKAKHFNTMLIHHSVPGFAHRTAQGWTGMVWDEATWWQEFRAKLDRGMAGTWQDTRRNDLTNSMIWLGAQAYSKKRVLFMGCWDMYDNDPNGNVYRLTPVCQMIGGRRYPFQWTGDCDVTWAELKWQIKAITNHQGSMKAVTYLTNDGFGHDWKIQARWNQFLAFNTVARSHTQKPWQKLAGVKNHKELCEVLKLSDTGALPPALADAPSAESSIRKYLKLRYRLLPYLYTYAHLNHQTGMPICRPLLLAFPNDPHCNADQWPYQYMFGAEILVAPVYADTPHMDIYLPVGAGWIDYWDKTLYPGGQVIRYDTGDIEKLPLFVRAGAIIPTRPDCDWIDPAVPDDPLTFDIYPAGTSSFTLYEDDGESLAYRQGAFALTRIECVQTAAQLTLNLGQTQGDYAGKPGRRTYIFKINQSDNPPAHILKNERPLAPQPDLQNFNEAAEGWYAGECIYIKVHIPTDESVTVKIVV